MLRSSTDWPPKRFVDAPKATYAARPPGVVGPRSLRSDGFRPVDLPEEFARYEACLSSHDSVLYQAGIRGTVKRGNLAYANEHRPAALFAEITMVLMRRAKRLYADTPADLSLDGELFAIDASLIELSLAIFP